MARTHPIVLFDGACNFCNSTVNFLIRQDKKGVLRFAPLQSEKGRQLLHQYGLSQEAMRSFVLIDGEKAYQRSAAGLRLYGKLPWYWKWTQLFWIVPRPLRDGVYDFIARNRYRWFGQRESCMIPGPEVRSRFLF